MKPAPAKRVVVIGAGLGGLSTAISLGAAGFEVVVHEKNRQAGGKLNVLRQDGFSFDLGPSILTLPQYFESLFARAGRRFQDYVAIQTVTPHWRNFFEDGLVVDLCMDPAEMKRELAKLPGDPETLWRQWQAFLVYSKQQYDAIEAGYFAQGLDTFGDFLRFYGVFGLARNLDWSRRMAESIHRRIPEPHLRAILEYFIKYVGCRRTHIR